MNILPVSFKNNFQNNINLKTDNHQSYPKYQHTLARDTVSFSGLPFRDGLAINKESERALKDLLYTLKHELKGLIESESNPNGPIAAGKTGIHGRVKGAYKLLVKGEKRDKNKKKEIQNIGDAIGARIVLRDSSQQSFDEIFKIFGKLAKQGKFHVTEVENYRPSPKESYISQKTLDKFESTCTSAGLRPRIISEPKQSGYTAVQLNVKLPNGQIAEIQMMGRDVEAFKDVEDLFYKRFCDDPKPLDEKYALIQETIDKHLKTLTPFQKETIRHYISDGYKYAKAIPPTTTQADYDPSKFLPYPYSLPPELDFAYLFRMKETADYVAKLK